MHLYHHGDPETGTEYEFTGGGGRLSGGEREELGVPVRPRQGQELGGAPPALPCTLLQGAAILSCQLPGAEATAQEGVVGNTLHQGSRGRQLWRPVREVLLHAQ